MTTLTLRDVLADPLSASVADLDFGPDELGEGFGRHDIEMGSDPDGEADVRCVLVRYRPQDSGAAQESSQVSAPDSAQDTDFYQRPAVFFVHGMTDYFFQAHVARSFYEAGYAPYGVDLRKCGRAWREGQTWHHVTDQSLYDEDITLVHSLLATAHGSVVAVGHSTGGLDVTMWARRLNEAAGPHAKHKHLGAFADALACSRSAAAELHKHLTAVVLNSPWFGLQFDAATRFAINVLIPAVARVKPTMLIPGGINPVYGRSLHASEAGEWDYNLELKPLEPRPKYVSWLAGVAKEIRRLQFTPGSTGVPTLVMTSDKHHFARRLSEKSYQADLVLKPEQMWKHAQDASPSANVVVCDNALHDIFLSPEPVRSRALASAQEWLADVFRYHWGTA